jgi:hypothetical protein
MERRIEKSGGGRGRMGRVGLMRWAWMILIDGAAMPAAPTLRFRRPAIFSASLASGQDSLPPRIISWTCVARRVCFY